MQPVLIYLVLCALCFGISWSDQGIYKVGIVNNGNDENLVPIYENLVMEAKQLKLDMFFLPPITQEWSEADTNKYDDTIETISKLAKRANMYIAVELEERVMCQNKNEIFSNNIVFNRDGNIVSVYKQPVNTESNCNSTYQNTPTFTTDFGVTFAYLNIMDLMLKHPKELSGDIKNYLLSGTWQSELPFLTSTQLLSSWTRVTGINLVSNTRVYNGKSEKIAHLDSYTRIVAVVLRKEAGLELKPHMVDYSPESKTMIVEDLNQYTIRPVDLGASRTGLKDTVCHNEFCCEFFLKTNFDESKTIEPYSMVVFDGFKDFGSKKLGIQVCSIVACKEISNSCVVELNNRIPEVTFKELSIQGNFSHNSIQLPTTFNPFKIPLSINEFQFYRTDSTVSITLEGKKQLQSFGIYGRDFVKDLFDGHKKSDYNSNQQSDYSNVYDYIFNENMQEFYDYVWIRLRVMIFVVSIYILEMM